MSQTRDIGGTGFTSLADYIGANQGVLDAGLAQDTAQAHQVGDSLNTYLGQIEPQAYEYARTQGAAAKPGDVQGYTSAIASADQASKMGRTFGSQYGLAGSAANPVSGEQGFNAALTYGAHGGEYKSLGDYLTGLNASGADASLTSGNAAGLNEFGLEHQPSVPESNPEPPPMDPRTGHPYPGPKPPATPWHPGQPRPAPHPGYTP